MAETASLSRLLPLPSTRTVGADLARDDLEVGLLGLTWSTWQGDPVRPATRSSFALLAFLAIEGRPRPREVIVANLWPEASAASSGALRQALWMLRSALAQVGADPDAVIDSEGDAIGFREGITIGVDAERFEEHLRARPPRLEAALAAYRGELAEGLNLEYFAPERERLADLYEDALTAAALQRLASGDYRSAHDAALELLRRNPFREEAHVVLMEIYGHVGSRSQVSRQYRRLRALLASELEVDPLPETEAAYRAALRGCAVHSADRVRRAPYELEEEVPVFPTLRQARFGRAG
jgi:DNA-binding SARP family transcriptional activator